MSKKSRKNFSISVFRGKGYKKTCKKQLWCVSRHPRGHYYWWLDSGRRITGHKPFRDGTDTYHQIY